MQEERTYGSHMSGAKRKVLVQALRHEELPKYLGVLQKAKRRQEKRGKKGGQIGK